ncbi:MAG TPA: protein translocase subunit SecD, partial [Pseudohongiella sp.]|nr:protein translocase subunit SecD [Pseudohongiella sp.]
MLNKFPLWKNILVATVVALGLIYASPNLFPDDPALQISHENREVTAIDLGMATDALRASGIEYFGDELTDLGGLIRFNSFDDQLRAKSAIEQNLEGDYIVALNLAPTTPGFLQAVGAGKMNLGLDLLGGVHFLMEVDMETAQRRRMENTMNSIRQELRNERIRSRNLSLENINLIEARFEDEESRSQARTLIRENFADLQVIAREQGGDYLLEMSLTAE